MSDLQTLERTILNQIAAAGDEAALETVRVAALGKKGSISALLSTLGKMSPDERKTQGAAINLAKDAVTQALSARRDILKCRSVRHLPESRHVGEGQVRRHRRRTRRSDHRYYRD